MAWIRDYTKANMTGTVATADMPVHETDDLILFLMGVDATGTAITAPSDGTNTYTTIQNITGDNLASGSFYFKATSSSEIAASTTVASSKNMKVMILAIADVDTTTPAHQSNTASFSAVTHTAPEVTTTNGDTINLFWHFCDDSNRAPSHAPGLMSLDIAIPKIATEAAACWTFQETAGAVIRPDFELLIGDQGHVHTICLNSTGTPVRPAYADFSSPPSRIVHPLRTTSYTASIWGGGNVDPTADLTAGLGPNTETFNYQSLGNGTAGVYAYGGSIRVDTPSSGSANEVWGGLWNLSAADDDLTGKTVCMHVTNTSSDFFPALDTAVNGGFIVGFRSDDLNVPTSNAYRVWNVTALDTQPNHLLQHAVAYDVDDTALQWGADAGSETTPAFDSSAVTGMFLAIKKGNPTDARMEFTECHVLNACTITGGSTTRPARLTTFVDSMRASRIMTIVNQGGSSQSQVFSLQPLQVGNGSDTVYFNQDSGSLEFPTTASTTSKNLQWSVGDNGAGITFYGVSGDTISFTNSAISGVTVWDFAIHASSTSAATWNFSGLNIINADVVLRDVFTAASGMSFIDCPTFTGNSADLSGGCTFDNTAIVETAATQAALQLLVDNYANGTTKNNATALRLEYTGTGDITLSADAITWTDNTVDIHYNSTSASTLTISMQNGANATTSAISGSAVAVNITAPVVLYTAETTDIVAGSRLWVKNITTDTVVVDEIRATDWSLNYTEGTDFTIGDEVQIRVSHSSGAVYKEPFNVSLIAGAGFNALIEQEAWTAVNNWAIDGSAETDWSADGSNIDIDITGSGSSTKKAMVAWWAYYITTSDGINNFWGAYVVESTNSIRQEVSVVDVVIEKTSAGNFQFTDNDVRYYRSDFSIPYDTTGNSIFMDYSGVPLIVETGVSGLTAPESTQLFTTSTFDPAVDTVEGSETYQESLRLIRSEAAGKLAVSGTTVTIRDAADTKDRITATVDSNGQRTAVTTDVT